MMQQVSHVQQLQYFECSSTIIPQSESFMLVINFPVPSLNYDVLSDPLFENGKSCLPFIQ